MPMAVRYTHPTLPLTSYLIRYQSPRRPVTETRVPCSTRATTAPSRLGDERTRATSQATVAWPDASVTSAGAASAPDEAASPFSAIGLRELDLVEDRVGLVLVRDADQGHVGELFLFALDQAVGLGLAEAGALAALDVFDGLRREVQIEAQRQHSQQLVRARAGGQGLNVRPRQAIELDVIAVLLELFAVCLAGQELRLADLQAIERRSGGRSRSWRLRLGRRGRCRPFRLSWSARQIGTAALGRLTGDARHQLEARHTRPNDADRKAGGHDQTNPAKAQGFLLLVGNFDLQGLSSLCRQVTSRSRFALRPVSTIPLDCDRL